MIEPELCPFCGKEACYVDDGGYAQDYEGPQISCADPQCMPYPLWVPAKSWQSRPIEKSLQEQIDQLKLLVSDLITEAHHQDPFDCDDDQANELLERTRKMLEDK